MGWAETQETKQEYKSGQAQKINWNRNLQKLKKELSPLRGDTEKLVVKGTFANEEV